MKRRFILFVLLCAGLLTLVLSAVFLPIMKGAVDGGLRDSAKSALASAHVTGVTADSDWATVTLTGPQAARASALAAVGAMAHAGAVDKFVYRTTGPGAGPAGSSPSPAVSSAGSSSPAPSASSSPASAAGTFAAVTAAVSGTPSSVTLSGTVATAAEHQTILSAATGAYGAAHVTDHLTVQGGPAASADTGAVAQFGQLLRSFGPNVASGTVSLASGAIKVTATGRSAAGTAAANAAVGAAVGAASTAGVRVSGKVSAPAGSGSLTAAQAQAQIRSALGRPGITFAFGSAMLTTHSTAVLAKVAAILARAPHTRTLIAGYTDSKGSAAGNLVLSRARAQAVRTFLAGHGIAAGRMKTAGYGESHPVASNTTAAGQLANRRVVFTVQGS